MANVVLRVTYRNTKLPLEPARNAALQQEFGAGVKILEWEAPERPQELFGALRKKIDEWVRAEDSLVAVEADTNDPKLVAALAVARAMRVCYVPLLFPQFRTGGGQLVPDDSFETRGLASCAGSLRVVGFRVLDGAIPSSVAVATGELRRSAAFCAR